MASTVSWNLHMSVHPGRLDDLRQVMADMVRATREEPGALRYEWFLDAAGTTCHTNEQYSDSEAVLAHLDTFMSSFAERFTACVQPTSLFVYGEPSDAARAALDGFGAVYLGTFGGFAR